jgi:hypothetical protein
MKRRVYLILGIFVTIILSAPILECVYGIPRIVHEDETNDDGLVQIDYVSSAALAFGTYCDGPPNTLGYYYNPDFDVNYDGKINVKDIFATVKNFGWLHTNGKWIVDHKGNITILRGANFMGYEFGAWDMHTEEDYAKMASWGFNVVRLPIAWHHIEPQPGVYNSSYFGMYVDRDILWAKKYGIYIILDMHQYHWSNFFTYAGKRSSGVPAWAVNTYSNSAFGEYQAKVDFWDGLAANGMHPTLENPSLQDRLIDVWKFIASRYQNEGTIVGYHLFNEPGVANVPSFPSKAAATAPNVTAFVIHAIDAIRTVDNRHIIFYEPVGAWANKHATEINRSNIIFSFHFNWWNDTYDRDNAGLEKHFLDNYYNYVRNWNIPIFVSEISIEYDKPNADLWTRDIVDLLEKYNLGWTWWSYWKEDRYKRGLLDSDGNERTTIIQYLKS